jgi:hypothetical protein
MESQGKKRCPIQSKPSTVDNSLKITKKIFRDRKKGFSSPAQSGRIDSVAPSVACTGQNRTSVAVDLEILQFPVRPAKFVRLGRKLPVTSGPKLRSESIFPLQEVANCNLIIICCNPKRPIYSFFCLAEYSGSVAIHPLPINGHRTAGSRVWIEPPARPTTTDSGLCDRPLSWHAKQAPGAQICRVRFSHCDVRHTSCYQDCDGFRRVPEDRGRESTKETVSIPDHRRPSDEQALAHFLVPADSSRMILISPS